jgi:DNA-binding NarL/FixJ family response regulator
MRRQTAATGTAGVVIADRSDHFRETLRRVLSRSSCAVVGEAATLRDALRLVRTTNPRLVLLDVGLVIDQPARRLRRIADNLAGVTIVVLLNEDLPGYRQSITERWGYQCVAKENAETELPPMLTGRSIGQRAGRS